MDDKFFSELYEKYFNYIYNYIFSSILNSDIAEDLAANTFFNAYKYLSKKKTDIKNYSAWLFKIATNEVLQFYRKKKRRNIVTPIDEKQDLIANLADQKSENVDTFVDYLTIQNVLSELKPKERMIIEMHYFDRMSYEEMSDVLNLTVNNLRVKLHRALKKVADLLEK